MRQTGLRRSVRNAAIALVAAAGFFAASSGAASAADSNGPLADVHSLGPITLYDPHGHVVTGGSTTAPLNTEIGRAVGTGPATAGYRVAVEMDLWTPQPGTDPSQWDGAPLRAGHPDFIKAGKNDNPLSTTNFNNWTLKQDIALAGPPSAGSYANLYQFRLEGIANGPTFSPGYYTATIMVDTKTGTWRLIGSAGAVHSSSGSLVGWIAGGGAGVAVLALIALWIIRRRRAAPVSTAPRSAVAVDGARSLTAP